MPVIYIRLRSFLQIRLCHKCLKETLKQLDDEQEGAMDRPIRERHLKF